MTEEIKQQAAVRSFRVTDEVLAKFKELQETMGLTQDSALRELVNVYEMTQAKTTIPDRETEIANFQAKAGELVAAYLHSLQLNEDAEVRIRAEFALQLQTKDTAIADYQEQVKDLKDNVKGLREELAEQTAKAATADELTGKLAEERVKAAEAAEDLKGQIRDKESLVSILTTQLAETEKRAESVGALTEERDYLKEELTAALTKITAREREYEMQTERAAYAAEKAQNSAVEAVKAAKDQVIEDLRQKLAEAEIRAEKRIHELDTAKAAEIRKLEAEISKLQVNLARKDAENARLTADLADVQKAEG